MIVDCISDLHGYRPALPGGDLLLLAGDYNRRDTFAEFRMFFRWLNRQKYSKKILVAGNHDTQLEEYIKNEDPLVSGEVEYLSDSGTEWNGLTIWGSPWTKSFEGMAPTCKAFTVDTEEELADRWKLIPEDLDILITHAPPSGTLDQLIRNGGHGGSISLRDELKRIRPTLHIFGHIHEGYGKFRSSIEVVGLPFKFEGYPVFVNASHVTERYEPVNKPIRVEL